MRIKYLINIYPLDCAKDKIAWVGDGTCDDATNSLECNYDGNDCCDEQSNTMYCLACICFETGRILCVKV